ncbi:MAG: hypothetical protein KME16_20720 [Scytolyngbya sp. HA4215-MV1]|jgi:hypothetical protein|nr:hypothetical protein [Scytolyngbya sp. HA4215-MV1]
MLFPLLADAGLGPLFRDPSSSLIILLVLLAVVSLIEAFVLSLFQFASFAKSALWSLVMNVASTLIGGVFSVFVSLPALSAIPIYMNFGIYALAYLVISWSISILTEASILLILGWQPRKKVWIAVTTANTATYAIPLTLLIVFIFLRL